MLFYSNNTRNLELIQEFKSQMNIIALKKKKKQGLHIVDNVVHYVLNRLGIGLIVSKKLSFYTSY